METPKITKVELELDAVSGELRVMHDLLNIFANWFTYLLCRSNGA